MKNIIFALIFLFGLPSIALSQSLPSSQSNTASSSNTGEIGKPKPYSTNEEESKAEVPKTHITTKDIPYVGKFMELKTRDKQIIALTFVFCLVVGFGFMRYFLTGKQ